MPPSPIVRPFLKWPGGKFRLLTILQAHLPKRPYLIEPFVGAGALFLNTQHTPLVLNDLNADLINLYIHLRQAGKKFIADAKHFFSPKYNAKTTYYRLRKRFNHSSDEWEKALLFLYLNRHGYNGLCRYNLKGGYNVPFGEYKKPYFPEKEMLHFQTKTQHATFTCEDYSIMLDRWCRHKDISRTIFYCDPPYMPLSNTANFTSYAGQRFTLQHQETLANYARKLAKKGAFVMISNHDLPLIRDIYHGATLYTIHVPRYISCQAQSRQKIAEIIACFGKT